MTTLSLNTWTPRNFSNLKLAKWKLFIRLFVSLSIAFILVKIFTLLNPTYLTDSQAANQQLDHFGNREQLLSPLGPEHHSQFDYSLPEILNIPAFKSLGDHQPLDNARIKNEAKSRPDSVIAYYAQEPTECTVFPSVKRLRRAVRRHFWKHYSLQMLNDRAGTLVIHHEPNKLDRSFVNTAVNLAKGFNFVRLLVPDHRLEELLQDTKVIIHHHNTTDDIFAFMATARHLLVHTGDTSALGMLLAEGTVYHTEALSEYTTKNSFKWLVQNRVSMAPEKVSPHIKQLSMMGHVRPSCCELRTFGVGDEEKVICVNTGDFEPPCWILSVGSAGKFEFERDIIKKTACHIHTFDCTGEWEVPADIAGRATLHKLCLGSKSEGLFRTWEELIKIGSKGIGATDLIMPSFAKVDIEGYEFPAMKALAEGSNHVMPQQIAMEVHTKTNKPVGYPFVGKGGLGGSVSEQSFGELFWNLSKLGYELVHRADNPFCEQCSEVTLVRDIALPAE